MKFIKITFVCVSFLLAFIAVVPSANATDVFLVYAGEDKSIKKEVEDSLAKDFKVKSYNVDLLALADYSGKQKAISKISKAKLVVFIKDKAAEILDKGSFPNVFSVTSGKDIDNVIAMINSKGYVLILSDAYGNLSAIPSLKLKDIYLRTEVELNGVKVNPVHLPEDNPLRIAFVDNIIGMSSEELKQYWLKDGSKNVPPKSLSSEELVIKYIARKKGSIGYVSRTTAESSNLKIIEIK